MAKKKKQIKPDHTKPMIESKTVFDKYPTWITIGLLFLLLLIFYHQIVFQGKTLLPPDQINSKSTIPFKKDALDRGIYPLWCPYLFSGMPALGSLLVAPNLNIIDSNIWRLFDFIKVSIPINPWFFYLLNYLLFGGLMYAMLKSQKLTPIACMFGAVAVVFMPQYIAFTAFGHNTKFLSLALIPLIFFLVDRLLERKSPFYFGLTAIAIGFQLMRAHVQVSYYTFLFIGIFYLFKLFANLKDKKEFKPIPGAGVLLVGAIIAGIALSAVLYLPVQEYSKFSIRGGGPSGGLSYDYAAGWSFHPLEMITFIIPSFMGFGGDTYWGKMPFTDYPLYFSIIVFLLAGVAFILKRDRFTLFLGLIVIFSLLVSFGNFFPILYGPMFKLLPFFNKFRVPSMIHILMDFSLVALAAVGFHALTEFRTRVARTKKYDSTQKHLTRYFSIFLAVLGILFLFMLFGKSSYMEMMHASGRAIKQNFRELAYSHALIDSFKSLVLTGVAVFLLVQYLKGSVTKLIAGIGLVILVLVDLWWVNLKIIKPTSPTDEQEIFASNPVVQTLKEDTGLYRIFPVLDEKSGNWYMYHQIQNILGYHAAKLRIYQEFLEESGLGSQDRSGLPQFLSRYWQVVSQGGQLALRPMSPNMVTRERMAFDNAMLDMLNVKYIISHAQYPIYDSRFRQVNTTRENEQPYPFVLYENTGSLPRAYFADRIEKIKGRRPVFDYMKSGKFDPRKVAIIEEEPPFAIEPADSNSIQVTSHDLRDIKLEAKVKTPTILVLSEIYYPAGWKAYVDGKETKIYKTNYILRSIFLEPGTHKIVFEFNPVSFRLGTWVSVSILVILIGLVVYGGIAQTRHRKSINLSEENQIIT